MNFHAKIGLRAQMLKSNCLTLNFGVATYFCVALGKLLNLPESQCFHPHKANWNIYYIRVLGRCIRIFFTNLSSV